MRQLMTLPRWSVMAALAASYGGGIYEGAHEHNWWWRALALLTFVFGLIGTSLIYRGRRK